MSDESVGDYTAFLRAKIKMANFAGFDVKPEAMHEILFPHQADICRWAVLGGNRAIFASFGLGKSVMQCEWMRQIIMAAGGFGLIVCPLGVRQELIRDAAMLGVTLKFIRSAAEMTEGQAFYITNYETVRDGKLDPRIFTACSLDEASVLRSFGSKTYQEFLPLFEGVRFKLVNTATPSPNRFKELIHYAGFLGVMDTGQALTRFFQRDSEKAGNLTLYPHKEQEFWLWVSSWAVFVQRPSDLGYSDEGYDLPALDVHYHEVPSDYSKAGADRDGQALMFTDPAMGLSAAAGEKRDSMPGRVATVAALVAEAPEDHFVVWHDLEAERHALQAAIPEAVSVWGTQDLEEREQRIADFSEGEFRVLSVKPVIAGSGCNFQRHCHRAIFAGIGFKFNDFIQSCHRIQRFQQPHPVRIDIVHSESEREVLRTLLAKWAQHEELTKNMSEIIKKYGLNQLAMQETLARSIGVQRIEVKGDLFTVANNDCVEEAKLQPESSVDLIVTSIPFANHYEYSPSYNDFGHTEDNDHFWGQMDYLTPELLRILKPGRLYCCHVKDRILFGNVTGAGAPTVSPFHCEAIMHGRKHGFDYMGLITVITDVVRENNQTYRLGWSEQAKDGTKMGVGSPEYIALFRKPQTDRTRGYADVPVAKPKDDYTRARWQVDAHAFWRSSGNRQLTAEELAGYGPAKLATIFTQRSLQEIYDFEFHVRIGEELDAKGALPSTFMSLAPGSHHPDVWHDITRMLTLNSDQSRRAVEKHVCLARGSLVLTGHGFVPIEDVEVGDLVLTHRGRWRSVTVKKMTGIRPVVSLMAQGVGALKLTPEHKLWARKVRDMPGSKAHSRREAMATEPEWERADQTIGSYINLKLPPVIESDLSSTECWLIGRWLADGHVGTRGDFHVSIGNAKLEHFERMAGPHSGTHAQREAMQIRLKSLRPTVRNMLQLCGRGAAGKTIPSVLLSLPKDLSESLLQGYLSGDGYFLKSRNRWMASSVSRGLLLGLAMLAQRVYGAISSLYAGRPPGATVIDGRTVNTKQDWTLCFDIPSADRRKGLPFVIEDGAWKKVRSADHAGEEETWCLRVEEDESFTAEGCIVKNCPLQFDIVDRLIDRYSNAGEVVYDPFCGLGTVPYRAILKGRRGGGSELNAAYFMDQVHYLKAAERQVSMPSLFDLEAADAEQPAKEVA